MIKKNSSAGKESVGLPIVRHRVVSCCLGYGIRTPWAKRGFFRCGSRRVAKAFTRPRVVKPCRALQGVCKNTFPRSCCGSGEKALISSRLSFFLFQKLFFVIEIGRNRDRRPEIGLGPSGCLHLLIHPLPGTIQAVPSLIRRTQVA